MSLDEADLSRLRTFVGRNGKADVIATFRRYRQQDIDFLAKLESGALPYMTTDEWLSGKRHAVDWGFTYTEVDVASLKRDVAMYDAYLAELTKKD
jgi:hypothetical protein